MVMPLPGCPGCQHPTAGRLIAEALDDLGVAEKVIGVTGIGCSAGALALLNVDVVLGAHGRAPDIATAAKRLRPDALVFTCQGDGDCIAIGAGPFIGALTRGEKFTVIMCNNANYGTTGGQLAPTTLAGQVTTTTVGGRDPFVEGYPAHVAELAALFRGTAYSARGALNTAANYQRTKKYVKTALQKQLDGVGFSFVEILSACPPNWHMSPVEAVKWVGETMIVEFPLGEFKNVDSLG